MDYQRDMFAGFPFAFDCSYSSLFRELWRSQSDGTSHSSTRDTNHLIEKIEKRIRTMAPQKEQKAAGGPFYFVNVAVSEESWEAIDEMYPTAEPVFNQLTGVIAEGLKVSFAVNSRNDITICSLSDRREGSPTLGACLTGGGDGWYEALRVVLYKYTALLHGQLASEGVEKKLSRPII